MVGCKKEPENVLIGSKMVPYFANFTTQNIILDSKAQTISFEYSSDFKLVEIEKKGIASVIEFKNNIAIDTLLFEKRLLNETIYGPLTYKGEWYQINSYDQYMEVKVEQNNGAESRGIRFAPASIIPFVGPGFITQSGAQ